MNILDLILTNHQLYVILFDNEIKMSKMSYANLTEIVFHLKSIDIPAS